MMSGAGETSNLKIDISAKASYESTKIAVDAAVTRAVLMTEDGGVGIYQQILNGSFSVVVIPDLSSKTEGTGGGLG